MVVKQFAGRSDGDGADDDPIADPALGAKLLRWCVVLLGLLADDDPIGKPAGRYLVPDHSAVLIMLAIVFTLLAGEGDGARLSMNGSDIAD